jgi:hypothetical protein
MLFLLAQCLAVAIDFEFPCFLGPIGIQWPKDIRGSVLWIQNAKQQRNGFQLPGLLVHISCSSSKQSHWYDKGDRSILSIFS